MTGGVFLLGTSILAPWGGTLELVLFAFLAVFIGLTLYAHPRCRRRSGQQFSPRAGPRGPALPCHERRAATH
ncbi:MAG: hypothetical protein HYY53_02470 [candidate division NC10 bacterium]|nr:hypothetical protein [candidate division NC10 bacterium]